MPYPYYAQTRLAQLFDIRISHALAGYVFGVVALGEIDNKKTAALIILHFVYKKMEALADINNLSSLLAESRSASETRAEQFQQKPASTVPTQVVNRRGATGTSSATEEPKTQSKNTNSIWDEEEVPTEDAVLVNNPNDKRPAPRYEYSYKQAVGTEDTFLGMGDKTPLTQDCTHLVVKIHFPGSTMKELDLDVKGNRIFAASKTLRLFTYLPVNVDDANGKAAFDSKKEVLTVTLPIIHEF